MREHHLILGGCGFIGKHVGLLLANAGHRVSLADRLPVKLDFPPDVAELIFWKRVELASADWDSLLSDADVVHHYAWTSIPASANANPSGDLTANVLPTLAMLESLARRGGGRVVFISSGGTVYGRLQRIPVSEDHPLAPITGYGAGKAAAEVYLNLFRTLHGLDCRIARVANPYGAGQDFSRGQGAVTTFLFNAITDKAIDIWGDGSVVRDYVHISDVAHAMVTLATMPEPPSHIFNIGSGVGVSLNDIVIELEAQLGRKLKVVRREGRPFDVPINVLNIERAQTTLGWTPRLSFREGICLTLADLANQTGLSTMPYPMIRTYTP